jgi:hypothetical protein
MMTLTLQRDDQDSRRTLGTIQAPDSSILCQTLELPWLDNARDASCIPAGTYQCFLRWSPEHKMSLYWITGVEGRDDVEIHWGNFPSNTKGCVLVGKERESDAIDDSKLAFASFMAYLQGATQFTLVVADVQSQGGAQ